MKKVSKQQTLILHDLRGLEEEARQLENSPDCDIDQMFDVIKDRLQKRYRLLMSEQSEGASSAEILREINNLKHAAQSNDANLLKQVHQRVNELRTTLIFAPTPPKININAILAAIDHIGVESDSDTEVAAPQPLYTQPALPQPPAPPLSAPPLFNREQPEPTTTRAHIDHGDLPFSSFSRGRHSSQGSERQRSSDHDRVAVNRHRTVDEESRSSRPVDYDTRSQSSYHSSTVEPNRRQETASLSQKQNDMIPSDLLGPGAFSQPKPRGDDTRHSTNVSKTPIKEEPISTYESGPQERSAPVRPPGQGPKIEDICKNATIKRYFTGMTDFTNPTVDNWCFLEELYSPTLFFVKSSNVDKTRDEIQTRVFIEIETHGHTLRKTKSHTLGKLVLCCYSNDKQWYRGCIIQTHQEYRYTVLFVDYGNKETISYEQLRDMPEELMYMAPMCVQQCYLHGIMPPGGAEHWDPVATEALWDLVSNKQLKILVQNSKNQVYGVVLTVKEGRTNVNINNKLIEIGLAAPLEDNTSDSMKGLCTSPTRFAPPTAFQNTASSATRKTRNRSPVATRRSQRGSSPPPASTRRPVHGGSSPPPASTRRPHGGSSPPFAAPIQPPANVYSDHRSSAKEHSTSDSEEEPSVGRPPSFGSSHKPLSRQINSPPGSSVVFGDTSAKGRGNVFGNAAAPKGRGSLPDGQSSVPDRTNELARGQESYPAQNTDNNHLDQDTWRRDGFVELQQTLPPPNFTISHNDLETTAEQLSLLAPETRKILKAKYSLKSQTSEPDDRAIDSRSKSESTEQSPEELSDKGLSSELEVKTPSSGVDVISEEPANESPPPRDSSSTGVLSPVHGGMEDLEGEDTDNQAGVSDPNVVQQPHTLSATLQHILYDPRSYLLGDLTEEKVYISHKKGQFTKLLIESLSPETRLLPAMVTHVISPELFCVSILDNTNIAVLSAMTESLNLLYSNKPIWQTGDRVVRNVGGNIWKGKVVTINVNLLEVEWEDSETKQWVHDDLVEKEEVGLSKFISSKLAVTSCRVEFDVGEFCAARYTCPDQITSWYRAIVLDVSRKSSTKRVFRYAVMYVDYGNVETVDVQNVRPLPEKFSKLPAQSIPCYLPEIQAKTPDDKTVVTGTEDDDSSDSDDEDDDAPKFRGQYDRAAAKAFEDLILNERVYLSVEGEVVPLYYGYRREVEVDEEDALLQFRNSSLPVTITDRVGDKLINLVDEYIKEGHADRIFNLDYGIYPEYDPVSSSAIDEKLKSMSTKLTGIEGGRSSPLNIQIPSSELSSDVDSDTLSSFDPMSEDYLSDSNLIDHDKDDVGHAVYGQKLSNRTLCRFFSRGRVCYKGNNCRYLHQKKSDFHSVQSQQAMVVEHKPPSPTNDMSIIVQVTSVLTPFHFWAQILPHDINPGAIEQEMNVSDPLAELTKKMNNLYKFKGFRESKYYPAIGEIVAVKSRTGNDNYRRARVTETDEVGEGMCKVFHLDFGTFEIVHEKSLRLMDPTFIKELPFQAQEMLLADVRAAYLVDTEPVYVGTEEVSGEKEAAAAREFFLRQVSGKWLIAKVIERHLGGPLCIHLWDCSSDNYVSINKALVKEGFAESIYPLPDELTTDCGTMASSSCVVYSD